MFGDTLDVSRELSASDVARIVDHVRCNEIVVRHLTSFHRLGSDVIKELIGAFSTSLVSLGAALQVDCVAWLPSVRACSNLTSLDLSSSDLRAEEGASALASTLRALPNLERLDLGRCSLGSASMAIVAPSVGELSRLEVLNMQNNRIGVEGAVALAPALRRLGDLRDLNLEENGIGADGAAALAPALRRLAKLERLTFDRNGFGDAGVAVVASTSVALPNLKVLRIEYNVVGDASASAPALRDLLVRSPNLRELHTHEEGELPGALRSSLAKAVRYSRSVELVSCFDRMLMYEKRNLGYWEALAFFGGAEALGPRVVRGEDDEESVLRLAPTPAQRFVRACGDRGVSRLVVGMLVG